MMGTYFNIMIDIILFRLSDIYIWHILFHFFHNFREYILLESSNSIIFLLNEKDSCLISILESYIGIYYSKGDVWWGSLLI